MTYNSLRDRAARIQSGLPGDWKVFDGLIEYRENYGSGYRIYAVQRGATLFILLCGGDKGTQDRDIAKARALAADLE